MAQNGLTCRVEGLERYQAPDPALSGSFGALTDRLAHLAARLRGTPAPPIERQSPAEQTVRAGLAAAEGAETADEYVRCFWRAVAGKLREYEWRGPPWPTTDPRAG
jgi:hypothetical protein